MGLLEDIGRSPARDRPSSLVSESVNLMQNIESRNIAKAEEERKATIFNKQKQQWAREEKMLESQGDITLLPGYKMLSPKGQQEALKHFHEKGYTDERGRGKYRNILEGFKVMFDREDIGTAFMKDAADNTYAQITQLDQEIAKAANNPKKAQELARTKNTLMQRYFFLLGKTDEYIKMKAAEATGDRVKGPTEYAPDQQTWINNETRKEISINVRDPQQRQLAEEAGYSPVSPLEKGYFGEAGELSAKREDAIMKSATKARSQIVTLETMNRLLDRFESGKLAGIEKQLQQIGEAFGMAVDLKDLGAKEAFTAVTEELALRSRNMGEGMVLAGQMSDRDVQFLKDMNPQLVISKGGNRLIINIRKAIAKRESDIAGLVRQFKKENQGIFDQTAFGGYVEEKMGKSTIFGIPEGAELAGTDKVTGLPIYRDIEGKLHIPEF
jgi:hypothetical protein